MASVWACSFPDLSFSDDVSEAGADGIGASTNSPSGNGQTDGGHDADAFIVLVDGSDPDALIAEDTGGGKVDASGCAAANCDCDKDGYNDLSKPGCALAPGEDDCDDSDKRTHPDQAYLTEPAEPPRNGDWNCKNGVEKLFDHDLKCGLIGIAGCSGVQGFADDPHCGAEGTYVFCAPQTVVLCGVGGTAIRKQACR